MTWHAPHVLPAQAAAIDQQSAERRYWADVAAVNAPSFRRAIAYPDLVFIGKELTIGPESDG